MTTLDGTVRTFTADDLLICDADDRPIGVAGVMGGLDTEITDDDDHGRPRDRVVRAARRDADGGPARSAFGGLGAGSSVASIRTESSAPSPGSPSCCARPVPIWSCTRVSSTRGARPCRRPSGHADVRITQVNRILGTALDCRRPPGAARSDRVHGRRGDGDTRRVALPSWRPDSEDEIDVVEEVARHYGYERIGKTVPKSIVHGRLSATQQRRRQLRDVLLGLGISEAMPNPFLAPDTLAKAGLDSAALTISNPLVAEESVLRTSLRPGLLHAIAFNESHRRPGVALFEIGHVYPPGDGELPDEYEALCVVLAGRDAPGGDGGVARGLERARRRRADRPGPRSSRSARDPLGDAVARQATRSARSARSTRWCSSASTSPSGSRCSS